MVSRCSLGCFGDGRVALGRREDAARQGAQSKFHCSLRPDRAFARSAYFPGFRQPEASARGRALSRMMQSEGGPVTGTSPTPAPTALVAPLPRGETVRGLVKTPGTGEI